MMTIMMVMVKPVMVVMMPGEIHARRRGARAGHPANTEDGGKQECDFMFHWG
jgi:hypothetical protein